MVELREALFDCDGEPQTELVDGFTPSTSTELTERFNKSALPVTVESTFVFTAGELVDEDDDVDYKW